MEFFRNIFLKVFNREIYYKLREGRKIEKNINIFKEKMEGQIQSISKNFKF